jgi:regulator of replication initiation timing
MIETTKAHFPELKSDEDEPIKIDNDEKSDPVKGVSLKKLLAENEELKNLLDKNKKFKIENKKLKRQLKNQTTNAATALEIVAKWADKHYPHDKSKKKMTIPKKEFETLFTCFERIKVV